jgi:hypothetical protein
MLLAQETKRPGKYADPETRTTAIAILDKHITKNFRFILDT